MTTTKNCPGRQLMALIREAIVETRGTIRWDSLRGEINRLLESDSELAEYIDDDTPGLQSVLQVACEHSNAVDIAECLIRSVGFGRKGVMNYQGSCIGPGLAPLHLACIRGSKELIPLLVQYGADITCLDASGETPLHTAAKWQQIECFLELLRHGADIDKLDFKGKSARSRILDRLNGNVRLVDRIESAIEFARVNDLGARSWSTVL